MAPETFPGLPSWPPHPAEPPHFSEADRLTADLERNRDKTSGRLHQQEVDRAHAEEVRLGMHQIGRWG